MARGDNGGCVKGCLWGFLGFVLIALLSTVLACAGSTADSHSSSNAQQQTDTSISASDSGTEAESKQKDPVQTDATASSAAQAAKPSASDATKGQKLVVRFLDVGQGDAPSSSSRTARPW